MPCLPTPAIATPTLPSPLSLTPPSASAATPDLGLCCRDILPIQRVTLTALPISAAALAPIVAALDEVHEIVLAVIAELSFECPRN